MRQDDDEEADAGEEEPPPPPHPDISGTAALVGSSDEAAAFCAGDRVRVWWSMSEPPDWFEGTVDRITKTGLLRVQYPAGGGWSHHDPALWDIQKL